MESPADPTQERIANLCKGTGKALVFFIVPAVGLSFLLMRVTASALWMPYEWRLWVIGLGVSASFACYRYAAGFRDRFAPLPKELAGTVGIERTSAFQEDVLAIKKRRNVAAWRRASAWFTFLVVLVGVQVIALNSLVHSWKPGYNLVSNMFFGQAGRTAPVVEMAPDTIFEGPCYLEKKQDSSGSKMEGSFLFPIGFADSTPAIELVEMIEASYGPREPGNGRQFLIDHAPLELKELIVKDLGTELGMTKFLFVLVHLLIMISASFAYGLTFTWQDECGTWLAGLF